MGCNPIAEARNRLGLSKEDLGRKIGVSVRTVTSWESWAYIPDKNHARGLREVLGLSDVDVWKVTHRRSEKVAAPTRKEPIW